MHYCFVFFFSCVTATLYSPQPPITQHPLYTSEPPQPQPQPAKSQPLLSQSPQRQPQPAKSQPPQPQPQPAKRQPPKRQPAKPKPPKRQRAEPQPPPPPKLSPLPKVVIVSFGGFGKDILLDTATSLTPNLYVFEMGSASPESLIPVNPTKTPVNNFSIATGLYAEEHGVIDHCVFDEPGDQCDYEQYKLVESIMPIWIENQINGGISGVSMWSGSQHEYQEKFPIHYEAYKEGIDFKVRLETIIGWLCDEKQPANLVMAYFGELDKSIHKFAVWSEESKIEMQKVEKIVGTFIGMLENKNIRKDINVIFLGTQGAKSVWQSGGIKLNEICTDDTVCTFISLGTNAIVTPTDDKLDEVYEILQQKADNRYSVYRRDEIPDEWHLKELALFDKKIFLLAKVNYFFWNEKLEGVMRQQHDENYVDTLGKLLVGFNGYSNELSIMHSFFAATGPRFKPNIRVKAFQTIDVYPMLRELLEWNGPSSEEPKGEHQTPESAKDHIPTLEKDGVNAAPPEPAGDHFPNPEEDHVTPPEKDGVNAAPPEPAVDYFPNPEGDHVTPPEKDGVSVPPPEPADLESDQRDPQRRKTKMVQAVKDMLVPPQPKPMKPLETPILGTGTENVDKSKGDAEATVKHTTEEPPHHETDTKETDIIPSKDDKHVKEIESSLRRTDTKEIDIKQVGNDKYIKQNELPLPKNNAESTKDKKHNTSFLQNFSICITSLFKPKVDD